MSSLDLLNNDRRNSLETVDGELVFTEDFPDYLSKDSQGWVPCLSWLWGIKLPQKPSKEFPSQRGTIGLCLCAKTASRAHLLPRKECSNWCQGKAYALKSPGCQGCGGSKTIRSPGGNSDSWSVSIMLWEGLAFRPRSKEGFTLPSGTVIWQT